MLFAGSVGRTDLPGGDWGTLQASIASLLDAYPPETVVHPGPRPRDDARRGARPEPVPRRAPRRPDGSDERQDRAPTRHARRRPGRDAALAARHRRGRAALRALRLPEDPDAGLRGHGALRAHVGAGLRRRAEGDVHLHRPLRPVADAAARGHGADLPRLRRARHAPRPAAGEAVHDRADVPLRRPRQGPLPRALAGLGRGDRHRRPVDRRRADPALRHAAPPARRDGLPPRAQLDRLPRVPAGLSRDAPRLARGERAPPRRRHAREGRDEPAARLRQLPREARGGARSPRRGAEDRRVALRGVRRALRRRAGRPRRDRRRLHARPDARARPRLLHAHDVGVHRPDGQRELDDLGRRPLRRARRGDRRPADARASASAPGSSGCCIAMEDAGVTAPAARDRRLLRARGRSAAAGGGALARRAAAPRGRRRHRLRGPLAQGAADPGGSPRRRDDRGRRAADGAVLRAPGQADEPLAHADIVGRLSA